jgi:hypothetical protein
MTRRDSVVIASRSLMRRERQAIRLGSRQMTSPPAAAQARTTWRARAGDLASGARLLFGLPTFLRRPASPASAHAVIRHRLATRESTFLDLVEQAVYAQPDGPYRWLLRLAGCELGDLARLVRQDGIEGALAALYRAGVFLRADEAKGRQPVVRSGQHCTIRLGDLRNPLLTTHFRMHTGGSGGAPTAIPIDLATIRDRAVNRQILLAARGGLGATYVEWGVPGSQTLFTVLEYAHAGLPVRHWLLKVDPESRRLHAAYRWSLKLTRAASLIAGRPLAHPEHVPADDALTVARRIAGILAARQTAWYNGTVSSGVAIAAAAEAAGLDLRGARFSVGSEPMTKARQSAIRRAGVSVTVGLGTTETSRIGYGCLDESTVNEVHLLSDLNAVIQPGSFEATAGGNGSPALPPRALLLTTVSPTAPLIALNLSLGDQAYLDPRDCGCPYQQVGWTTHVRDIESFEKLNAGGMTFLDTDLVRIVEADLPARFGGGPTDYQLLEEEAADGRPRVVLFVRPEVGALDPAVVSAWFLDRLGRGSGAEYIMASTWRQSGILEVARRAPRMTAAGKILPVLRSTGRATSSASAASPSDRATHAGAVEHREQ